jgi:ferredoxin
LPADQLNFIKLNLELSTQAGWKSITKRKPAPTDADEWKDKTGKLSELIR